MPIGISIPLGSKKGNRKIFMKKSFKMLVEVK
ncbi:hypothetical protein SAMN05216383_102128 [Prevotella sp. KH2C16]|nr:hypothetical protein SAMN05216383_102128 [Prevotella sp. KH2C16]